MYMFKFSYKTILKCNTITFCKFQFVLFGSFKIVFFSRNMQKIAAIIYLLCSISMLYDVFYSNWIHILSSYDVKGEKARRTCISRLPRCCSVGKSCPTLWPWTAARQASLSFTISWKFSQTHACWVSDAI